MGVMSPTTPDQEMAGMKAAEAFFAKRSWMDVRQMRQLGQWGYSYFVTKGQEAKGDGFRRMAYILSQSPSDPTSLPPDSVKRP